jgi:amino acid transporter
VRLGLYVVSILVIIFSIFALIAARQTYQATYIYNLVTTVFFAVTFLLCISILIILICTIQINFKGDVGKQRMQLLVCQSIFVVGFMIRVILIICVQYKKWDDFTTDYPNEMHYPALVPLQFMLYNILPYMALIYLHMTNLKQESLDDESSEANEFDTDL